MIPLYFFLIAWFVLLAIFGFMALLSVIQMMRFGLASPGTWLTTTIFFVVSLVVIFGTSAHLLSVDWSQTPDLFSGMRAMTIFNP